MDICQIATKVISGEQALAAFRVYRTERIFILCDSFLTQSGAIDLLTRQIAPTNQVQVFDDVVPDPNLSGVARATPMPKRNGKSLSSTMSCMPMWRSWIRS